MENSVLDDVCAVVGYTATRIIVAWYGGRSLYVPASVVDKHPLATLIGLPALRALSREFGGGAALQIPSRALEDRYQCHQRIAAMLAAGATNAEVAETVGLTLRRVQQLRVELAGLGWIREAEAFARRRGRPTAAAAPRLLEILGTGEVSDRPPTPSAASA